ncbi:MAG: anthranilate synthase component I family protein [Nitrospirae bacterium]|nr:anthranilate synthase component I family protein [Nitrospirota bacterium]
MHIIFKEIPWTDPFNSFISLRGDGPSFIFESHAVSPKISRYSFIGVEPKIIIKSKSDDPDISIELLRQLSLRNRVQRIEGIPPFVGGTVGYFGYGFAHLIENLPYHAIDDLQIPDIVLMNVDLVVSFDNVLQKGWIVATVGDNGPGEVLCRKRIKEIEDKIRQHKGVINIGVRGSKTRVMPNLTKKEYVDMVKRCKEYISAGDIFQANLSQRLSAHIKGIDPLNLYRILREINPSPFSAFFDTGDIQLVSSSPERLVRLNNGIIESRPIAGTRPRGVDLLKNRMLQQELLSDEKERAEHIMLVDLERNDLGRVCRYGTVRVDEFMVLEPYSHVTHIVSNITGSIRHDKDAMDLIQAVFPGGTITGVPKIRCMEIIDELEPTARGPYTGSLGYFSNTGDIDFNIIIRTFVIKDGWAHVQVGAGIVADSDPVREYNETLYKAEALIKTLEFI